MKLAFEVAVNCWDAGWARDCRALLLVHTWPEDEAVGEGLVEIVAGVLV